MVFLCCRVDFSVINAHSPPCDGTLWNELIFIVFNDRHSSFLWNHLDGTNPVTMWYVIHNLGVKKFEDFLLHDFSHHIVEPMLRLSRWCTRRINWNAMSANIGLIPLRSCKEYPKTSLCFSKIAMSLVVSSLVSLSLMIIGVSLSPFRKA